MQKYNVLMMLLVTMLGCLVLPPERQYVPTNMRLDEHTIGNHFYQVEEMFRLDTHHILECAPLLLPAVYQTSERDNVNCVEGLCIVLRRLAFPT